MFNGVKLRSIAAVGAVALVPWLLIPIVGRAQAPPDRENGRYTFSQTSDGFLRLDTRTGSVSTCNKRGAGGWACYLVPDERDAFDREIGRLQADNARLKEQLAGRDLAEPGAKTDAPLPKSDSLKPGEGAQAGKVQSDKMQAEKAPAGKGDRIELPLPDDREIDRVVSFLERAWKRLVEAANRMQRDVTGKI